MTQSSRRVGVKTISNAALLMTQPRDNSRSNEHPNEGERGERSARGGRQS